VLARIKRSLRSPALDALCAAMAAAKASGRKGVPLSFAITPPRIEHKGCSVTCRLFDPVGSHRSCGRAADIQVDLNARSREYVYYHGRTEGATVPRTNTEIRDWDTPVSLAAAA
jgi:hypothetical protein